jgi:hypothetical protein
MGLNIKLAENWKLKSDCHQFFLVRIDENGREFIEGYYSSIESCLQALFIKRIRASNAEDIQTLILEIKAFQSALNKALQPINLEIALVSELNKLKSKE